MPFPFATGPAGRNLVVDASGRLIATGEAGNQLFPFGFGDTGRALVVDGSGRLVLSPESPGVGSGLEAATDADIAPFRAQAFTSGGQTDSPVFSTNGMVEWRDSLYIGTSTFSAPGGTIKKMFRISFSDASGVTVQTAFNMPPSPSGGWPGNVAVYRDKLYTANLDGSPSGIVWQWDGTTLRNVGMPSGSDDDVSGATGQRANILWGMGLYNNKLIIGTANNLEQGPQSIFSYDAQASGASAFRVLYKQRTTGSNFGFTQGFVTYNDKFFTCNENDRYYNFFDGVRGVFDKTPVTGANIRNFTVYRGKLYGMGKGVWEWNEDQTGIAGSDGPWLKVYENGATQTLQGKIYNGKMWFGDDAGNIHVFDGSSWKIFANLGASIGSLGVLGGRLFAITEAGAIFHMTESTEEARGHGLDNFTPTGNQDNKEYIKKYGEFMGNQSPFFNSTGADLKRFPQYTSLNVLQQGVSLASGLVLLDQFFGSPSGAYLENQNLIPTTADTFDIGSESVRFKDIYAGSGNFINGLGNDGQWNISPSGRLVVRSISSKFITIPSGTATANIDFNNGYNQKVTLGQNMTFTFHNPLDGERYLFRIKQDDLGGRTITWPVNVTWGSGLEVVLGASSGIRDVVTLFYEQEDDLYYGGFTTDFF